MLLCRVVECSSALGETRSRRKKTTLLAGCLAALEADELLIGVHFLAGELRQGRIGLGYAAVFRDGAPAPTSEPLLTLVDVDIVLTRIQEARGKGSAGEKKRLWGELMKRSTSAEQGFLRQLVAGGLRQGALEAMLLDGIAKAAEVSPALVRRAQMLTGDLGAVAQAALLKGEAALQAFQMRLFQPVQPMLAQPCEDPAAALAGDREMAFEHKLDGARIQLHRSGSDVAIYSRRLHDVTAALPEIVEWARALPCREIVMDGEVIALAKDGRPQPFQTTMRRFGRRLNVDAMRQSLPLSPFYFDLLYLDGEALIDESARTRYASLDASLPPEQRVVRMITAEQDRAEAFFDAALLAGQEGVMAKALDARYSAGKRGSDWLKIKPTHTLDLVVLAVEDGSGRRRGWLSNIHLGARNADGTFTMLGKTFKGMTDAMLRWQTERFQQLALGREGHVTHVRPEVVVEVAFNDVQESPHYPGGLALRFARVKRYREDKAPEDADTLETVLAIHRGRIAKQR